MPRHTTRLALALSLALAGSPLLASSGPRTAPPPRHTRSAIRTAVPLDLLDRFRQHLTALWGAEGCGGDPNGVKCSQALSVLSHAVVSRDEGCGADPDGLCTASR